MERPPAPDLHLGALLRAFAVLSMVLLVSLVVAARVSRQTEWRAIQERYNARATAAGKAPIPVGIQQTWRPELGITDRCGSCHLGMVGAPLEGDALFAAHPPVVHAPRELGCTVCHGGQGRATTREAAHGNVRFWDEPMLARADFQAGCGSCHTHVRLPAPALAARGAKVVEEQQCGACHQATRRLDTVGLRGITPDWHERHIGLVEGEFGFAPLPDEDLPAVDAFLATRVGAPRLVEARLLMESLGCRGCHRIGGAGGEEGPDLSSVGRKPAGDYDLTEVRGPRTPRQYLYEHFLEPGRLARNSRMPAPAVTPHQADLLTFAMLALRTRPLPEALLPRDRVRAVKLGERDFPTDGESLFRSFCSGCHGAQGEGRTWAPVPAVMPGIGRAEFLALADDTFIRKAITDGRPGRMMPAWGSMEGGLRRAEIDALVTYVRTLQPAAVAYDAVLAAAPDPALGREEFARSCVPCHGEHGEGSPIAPPLAAPDNQAVRSDNAIYGTLVNGVAGTAMGAFRQFNAVTLSSLVATVRALPPVAASRTAWKPARGDAAAGAALFGKHCGTCHGDNAVGKEGPALSHPAFQAAASDGYLAATVIRGRPQAAKAMPGFGQAGPDHARLSPDDVAALVAFLRGLVAPAGTEHPAPAQAGDTRLP
ncbi:MAG: c-type cytochrome [Deltaproteobacteria bacterium]|nr:c-type cytochrome [Deltaproteobacteria bacterium]